MKINHFILPLFFVLSISITAQDAHFSYYQFAPSTVNPALTGAFYGNIRATALTRAQWFNVRTPNENGNQGFSTLTLLIDGNLPFGFKKGDWVSAGLNILTEGNTAGIVDTKRTFNGLSVAYHMSMGKKNPSVLSVSAKYGKYGIGFTQNDSATSPFSLSENTSITEDDDYQNAINGAMNGNIKDDTNDLMFGLMLTTPMGKNSDMRIGIASDHLLAPSLTTDTTGVGGTSRGEKINRRINAFVQLYTDLSDKLTFNPSILYQKMGKANNILLQGLFAYMPNPKKDITFNFGLGVRLASNMDVPIYLGADFKDWRVGLAFDTNISGLTQATSNAGAYELGISKIFSWNKKAQVKPKFICPRL
jgi:type IX secretion system PorP/SprF family membrane protein